MFTRAAPTLAPDGARVDGGKASQIAAEKFRVGGTVQKAQAVLYHGNEEEIQAV
jgi:hypothetical protein